MKRVLICVLAFVLLLSLVACEVSSYKALMLIKIVMDNHCEVSFDYLDGKLVLKPRYTRSAEGDIHYSATLEEGEINVYYVFLDVKQLLFNIKAGESIDSRGGYIEKGRQTIIIETVTPAKGKITISFD